MKKRTGFGLGALIAAGALALAGPASAADCIPTPGKDAVSAVYKTVTTPEVPAVPEVPLIQHDEFILADFDWFVEGEEPEGWTKTGESRVVVDEPAVPEIPEESHVEEQWSQTPLDGWTETEETRYIKTADAIPEISHIEYEQTRTVIDQEYVPEVPEISHIDKQFKRGVYTTEYKFCHKFDPFCFNPKWSSDRNWNADENGNSTGWLYTGITREILTSWEYQWFHAGSYPSDPWIYTGNSQKHVTQEYVPAIPEQSHVETQWSTSPTVDGWTATGNTRVVIDQVAVPEQGYTETRYTRTVIDRERVPGIPEVNHVEYEYFIETGWLTETETAEYEGWQVVDQRTVTDQEYVPGKPAIPAKSEQVLVTAAVPAVAAVTCPALAETGAEPWVPLSAAAILAALGGVLMLIRRKANQA